MRILLAVTIAGLLALFPAAAFAERTEDQAQYRARLFEALKDAPTEQAGRALENEIWKFWMAEGPTPEIRRDVAEAMRARDGYNFDKALDILNGVVAVAPDYAEGWNQRAFIHFLKGSLDRSLEDIDRALELEPMHFAAYSGRAIILMQQGRMQLGQRALREAIAIHPWIKERHMLIPEAGETSPPADEEEI